MAESTGDNITATTTTNEPTNNDGSTEDSAGGGATVASRRLSMAERMKLKAVEAKEKANQAATDAKVRAKDSAINAKAKAGVLASDAADRMGTVAMAGANAAKFAIKDGIAKAGEYKDQVMSSEQVAVIKNKAASLKSKFSPETQSFLKEPTVEKLVANPNLIFTSLALLQAIRHPGSALFEGVTSAAVNAAGTAAMQSQTVQNKIHDAKVGAVQLAVNSAVSNATAGQLTDVKVPKEVLDTVVRNITKEDMMQMVSVAKSLHSMGVVPR